MEKEKRIIYADDLREEIASLQVTVTGLRAGKGVLREYMEQYRASVLRIIDEQPTVEAVEVVHGYNIDWDTPSLFECSVCHWSSWDTYTGDTDIYNYCPNCGAKMDGQREG